MKHGDIVLVDGRLAVALMVTTQDIVGSPTLSHNDKAVPIDVRKPGIYPFAGYWYHTSMHDLLSWRIGCHEIKYVPDPLNVRSYGKILSGDPNSKGRVVGRVRDHFQIQGLKI